MTDNQLHTIRWAKLKPAAQYASIGQKRLKALAKSGKVVGYKDPESGRGDWIFDLRSIDRYRISLNPKRKIDEIVDRIWKNVA